MTFLRLTRWDWVAFAAALGLLLTMSFVWWTTNEAEECRRVANQQTAPDLRGPQNSEIDRKVQSDAERCEAKHDKTAWSAPSFIDVILLLALLTAIASAIAAAFLRAADRSLGTSMTPTELATYAGLAATLLILYRVLQPPGLNAAAVVKPPAIVGLVLAGVLTIAARSASAAEREAAAAADVPPPD
ncbi:MAG TPA: hypothetical protein VJT75_16985, partial [Thermoleophilaceae bacterium]|nr:hypothetical protein [Thermoleophilaceae bacterium]